MSQEGQTWKEVPFLRLGSGFETVQFNTGIDAGRQLVQGHSSGRGAARAGGVDWTEAVEVHTDLSVLVSTGRGPCEGCCWTRLAVGSSWEHDCGMTSSGECLGLQSPSGTPWERTCTSENSVHVFERPHVDSSCSCSLPVVQACSFLFVVGCGVTLHSCVRNTSLGIGPVTLAFGASSWASGSYYI